tara:strand:- start:40 stop:186 length:147 start_codon:yes stop_codon:yes gene_type:complete
LEVALLNLYSRLGAMHLLKQFAFMKKKLIMAIKILVDVWKASQGNFDI